MEVGTSPSMRKKYNEDLFKIAEKLQEKGASLKKGLREVKKQADSELADPNITPETASHINELVEIAKDSFAQANVEIIECMEVVTGVLTN